MVLGVEIVGSIALYCTPANSWKMLPSATSPTPSHR